MIPSFWRPNWWWLLAVLPLALVLYYGIGMGMAHIIDDDPDFGAGPVSALQSRSVAIASRLILREVDEHKWVANDPFFTPGWALDDMPSYQTGIVGAIGRFATAAGQLAMIDGQPDPELDRAAGLLKYPGTVWKFDPSASWMPTASSEKQYRSAARNMQAFNDRLAAGKARLADDDQARAQMLGHLGADMDATAGQLAAHMEAGRWTLFDTRADNLFYEAKGRIYAQSLLLGELRWDFPRSLASHHLDEQWQAMVAALRRAATMRPAFVLAGGPESWLMPNHLAFQGFYLLEARTRLDAILVALRG